MIVHDYREKPMPLPRRRVFIASSFLMTLAACTGSDTVAPSTSPPGVATSTKTDVLEAGAAALQSNAPLGKMDIYLVGFHPMKNDPSHQMEAHHFCHQVNEDFAQCALFDGNTADANLNGIEYIISERLFEQLPAKERQYWHPHNGEILSGQLVAPNLPGVAEHELMKSKMNSYGKTWHTWQSEHGTEAGEQMPYGSPLLAWSFNREGEAQPGLVEARDREMGISTSERSAARRDLLPLAHPQEGVDALKGKFPRRTQPIPGVVDKQAAR
jgi:Protein of unknown function (DUF1264)